MKRERAHKISIDCEPDLERISQQHPVPELAHKVVPSHVSFTRRTPDNAGLASSSATTPVWSSDGTVNGQAAASGNRRLRYDLPSVATTASVVNVTAPIPMRNEALQFLTSVSSQPPSVEITILQAFALGVLWGGTNVSNATSPRMK